MAPEQLTSRETAQLRSIILMRGLKQTSADFSLNPMTLLRAAVGLPLHRSTTTVVRQILEKE